MQRIHQLLPLALNRRLRRRSREGLIGRFAAVAEREVELVVVVEGKLNKTARGHPYGL
jgi:hypothetical protein